MKIRLDTLDHGPFRRDSMDAAHVLRLANVTERTPPIVVRAKGERYEVLDGTHRWHAAQEVGLVEIDADVLDIDDIEALEMAVRENTTHGLPFTLAERKRAAALILKAKPNTSNRYVAEQCGLDDQTVKALRPCSTAENPQLNKTTGADGRARPATKADADAARKATADYLLAHPAAPLREVATATGVGIATAAKVRTGLEQPPSRPTLVPQADPTPSASDVLLVLPKRYQNEEVCRRDERTIAFAKFMDQRLVRQYEALSIHINSIPAELRDAVKSDALAMAGFWAQFADDLSKRSRLRGAS